MMKKEEQFAASGSAADKNKKRSLLREKIKEKREARAGGRATTAVRTTSNARIGGRISKEHENAIRDNFDISATQMELLNQNIRNGHVKNEEDILKFMLRHKIKTRIIRPAGNNDSKKEEETEQPDHDSSNNGSEKKETEPAPKKFKNPSFFV